MDSLIYIDETTCSCPENLYKYLQAREDFWQLGNFEWFKDVLRDLHHPLYARFVSEYLEWRPGLQSGLAHIKKMIAFFTSRADLQQTITDPMVSLSST